MKHRSLAFLLCVLLAVLALGPARVPVLAALQAENPEPQAEPEPEEPEPAEGEEAQPEAEPPPEEPQAAPEAQAPAPPQVPPQAPPQAPVPQAVPSAPPQPTPQPSATLPPPAAPKPAAAAPAAPAAAPAATPAPVVESAAPPPAPAPAPAPQGNAVPRQIAKIQQALRVGAVGKDPNAVRLMDRIDQGGSAKDYDALAVYLAKRALPSVAEPYADVAVKLDKTHLDYWLNLGTIRLQQNKLSAALTAYKKANKLDPSHALTWYSMGVVHDYMRNYDEAIRAYTAALALDPKLGEYKTNPQAVNNDRLLVVNLLLYQAKEGGLSMPFRAVPEAAKPVPAPAPGATKPH